MNQTDKKVYDLEQRTGAFGKDVIVFCKLVKRNAISLPLISQIVRSATSIGANYMEADIEKLEAECQELILIFGKIASNSKLKSS